MALSGPVAVTVAQLSDALEERGWVPAELDDESPIDLAVYLDHLHPPAAIDASDPRAWIDALTGDFVRAFAFLRIAQPRLEVGRGMLVVATSLAGRVGVPGRSLDSAVSAGLEGLARSFALEYPALSVACVTLSLPSPRGTWASADVTWPRRDADPFAPAGLAVAASIIVSLAATFGGTGAFVTVSG